jgi:hypothetical protein
MKAVHNPIRPKGDTTSCCEVWIRFGPQQLFCGTAYNCSCPPQLPNCAGAIKQTNFWISHSGPIHPNWFDYDERQRKSNAPTPQNTWLRHQYAWSPLTISYSKFARTATLSIYLSTALLLDLGRIFIFLIFYTVGKPPWTADQPVARPLPVHRTEQTQNKRIYTSTPRVGFATTIPVFELAKTIHAFDRSATVIGYRFERRRGAHIF